MLISVRQKCAAECLWKGKFLLSWYSFFSANHHTFSLKKIHAPKNHEVCIASSYTSQAAKISLNLLPLCQAALWGAFQVQASGFDVNPVSTKQGRSRPWPRSSGPCPGPGPGPAAPPVPAEPPRQQKRPWRPAEGDPARQYSPDPCPAASGNRFLITCVK